MFLTIDQFKKVWTSETAATLKLFDALTDDSLNKPEFGDMRTVGRAAWHIVTTYPEMGGRMGLTIDVPTDKTPIPKSAAKIRETYQKAADAVLQTVSGWSDDDLKTKDDMYGESWERGRSLWVFLVHEIHHRGQLTVLMRLAELNVPGIYGPSHDEWEKYGMKPPTV